MSDIIIRNMIMWWPCYTPASSCDNHLTHVNFREYLLLTSVDSNTNTLLQFTEYLTYTIIDCVNLINLVSTLLIVMTMLLPGKQTL